MSRAPAFPLAWAALVLVLGVLLWAVFAPAGALFYALPAIAVAGAALIALGARLRRPRPAGSEEVVTLSVPTTVATVGVSIALVGLAVGPWMYLIGAGVTGLGLFGLARELQG